MRASSSKLERCRYEHPTLGRGSGMRGCFLVPIRRGTQLFAVSSGPARDGHWSETDAWEHVSVSACDARGVRVNRCPTWEEMAAIKDLFWGSHECVVQFHPPRSEYVNDDAYVLHLWRPPYVTPTPPKVCI